jgi:peroxiredoxin
MAVANPFAVPVGSAAPDFRLPAIGGREVALADFAGEPALLVAFLCNHCPFVRHVEAALAAFAAEYARRGLATVAINPNDTLVHPDDDAAHMAEQAERAGFGFPYLVDGSQAVARAYRAACTPDLFLYDRNRALAYRGEFDGSRPRSSVPVTGDTLRKAADLVLAGQPVPEPHPMPVGCGIKWKPGNEPG